MLRVCRSRDVGGHRVILRKTYQVIQKEEDHAMTSIEPVDPCKMLSDQLAVAGPDLLRNMMSTFIQALMSAEADAVCGAGYGERSDERVNSRNGYRHRDFDTRVGTIDLAIPKLRSGTYFPEWLLERRKRAERALTSVVATCYLLGVSTRRMEKLVESLGVKQLSKSQVSIMTADLDAQVEAFRTRPLDAGPYTFLAADALVLKVRENIRDRGGHASAVTPLIDFGTGHPYLSPSKTYNKLKMDGRFTAEQLAAHRYFKVPSTLWTTGLISRLTGPGLAMLLVLRCEQQGKDVSPVWFSPDRARTRFGLAESTRRQGLDQLRAEGVVTTMTRRLSESGDFIDVYRQRKVHTLTLDTRPAVPPSPPTVAEFLTGSPTIS